jgi:hypothetical protein
MHQKSLQDISQKIGRIKLRILAEILNEILNLLLLAKGTTYMLTKNAHLNFPTVLTMNFMPVYCHAKQVCGFAFGS